MQQPLIEVKNLKKYFETPRGNLHAVDGINFKILPNRTLGVVGESGCGKSTLGRVLLRLIEATEGEILFEEEDILKFNDSKMRKLRKNMQIVFQDPYSSLNPRRTVAKLISEPLISNRVYKSKKELENRIVELMDLVGLAPRLFNAYPHELDGGRRQRVGLARALALNPKFIVCDEPVSALDVSIQAQILNLLMDLQDKIGLSYLFITHDLSVVKHISDEIMVMYLGKCVEMATSDELFHNPKHPYTQALLSAVPSIDIDNKRKNKLLLKGEVTSPINPKPGCRFAARCEFFTEKCLENEIELKEISTNHFVACRLYEEPQK